ncbi:hypothetical protein BN59_01619 [Legionella massiliensis]|uniref:Uncharacterized protein n=1 Tax=Legionella massiliensis TaxID=1034943 RepID=A0A078KWG4_9GAMM|nr:hypothetical protein [Legionella massiliensis]CDZ77336.1 hypothetical protein BN59_01619 [Legionella massiliensis]CEE13074.1 hypothetical protein BN1094_01619 [Legionella massiliensis]
MNNESELTIGSVDDYIQEFNRMLSACEHRAQRGPADRSARSAKEDAQILQIFLKDLKKAQEEGYGSLPILRSPAEWAALDAMKKRCDGYTNDNAQFIKQSNQNTQTIPFAPVQHRTMKASDVIRAEIGMQLGNDQKKAPDERTKNGLNRTEQEITSRENTYTTPTPCPTSPKRGAY